MSVAAYFEAVNGANPSPKPTIEITGSVLTDVANPFGLAMASGANLNQLLADDPHGGDVALEFWVQASRESIKLAFDEGAEGILYRLHGATANHSTPMQYGGHHLERDRELLTEAMARGFVALFIVGGDETYLDVVSDLPAHAIGWDIGATGYSLDAMREMRSGATFTTDPRSEILLVAKTGGQSIADALEGRLAHV